MLLTYMTECHYYFANIKQPSSSGVSHRYNWWSWPLYHSWTIHGGRPRIGNTLNATLDKYNLSEDFKHNEVIKFPARKTANPDGKKLILFSAPPFNEKKRISVDENLCGRCEFSYDTKLWSDADAVIHHVYPYQYPLKKRSFPAQLYVWMCHESPSTTAYTRLSRKTFREYDNMFNLTMTYRRDSGIYFPYFTALDVREEIRKNADLEDLDVLFASKDHLAAWAFGNCLYTKGSNTRTRIMLQLLELGLDVDVFGSCVFRSLPGHWWEIPQHLKRYKFYFSLENALHCRDYVTEKSWWNGLRAGTVPVIWGPMRTDVEAILPEGSFIFVEDFSTPQHLVSYLNYLDQHEEEYREYFNWRKEPISQKIPGRLGGGQKWTNVDVVGYCQLCHMLHDDDEHEKKYGTRPKRVVSSLYNWWYIDETKTCLTPRYFSEYFCGVFYYILFLQELYFKALTMSNIYVRLSVIAVVIIAFFRTKWFKK
ncbi:unnamed protein product [Clavelina lepadiformis]|uniref:Fucosyltransferase n=1 Tax=Clavelina lepadiformis TaxID=159417 RepID=A0ABP0GD37_CLALP